MSTTLKEGACECIAPGGSPCTLARDWGRRGWPIEEVAEQLGRRPADLPLWVWDEHELGMREFLDEPGENACPLCGCGSVSLSA